MENIIETLKDYQRKLLDNKQLDISRRCLVQKALLTAEEELTYANKLCKANNIKLGD
jgi:hypothetical protein